MENPLISESVVQTSRKSIKFNCVGYGRKSTEEINTQSIKNQSLTIRQEYQKICEEDSFNQYSYLGYLSDEDFTGTNSNRPDFQKLLQMIVSKEVNMIIVCDLSRLSRNMEETLHYVQGLFVSMQVRFICLDLPRIDSYADPNSIYNIQIQMHGMMNENFAAETSVKVKNKFRSLMKAGCYIGAFAPYGWNKDPEDHHKLIIDEYAYKILHHVKNLLLEGNSLNSISITLNEEGVLAPGAYERSKGLKHAFGGNTEPSMYWSAMKVKDVLMRPANIGTLVQGKQKYLNFKNHTKIKTKPEEWIIVENVIPPIFTKEEQERICNIINNRKSGYSNSAKQVYLFSGFLKCGDCGKSLIHKATRVKQNQSLVYKYEHYICNSFKNYKGACTSHRISSTALKNAVLKVLQQQIKMTVSIENVVKKSKDGIKRNEIIDYKSQTVDILTKEISKISRYKKSLYVDFRDGIIDRDEYTELKEEYNTKAIELQKSLDKLKKEEVTKEKSTSKEPTFLKTFLKHRNINELTREILSELIDHITVYDHQHIEICFKFQDEFENLFTVSEEDSIC